MLEYRLRRSPVSRRNHRNLDRPGAIQPETTLNKTDSFFGEIVKKEARVFANPPHLRRAKFSAKPRRPLIRSFSPRSYFTSRGSRLYAKSYISPPQQGRVAVCDPLRTILPRDENRLDQPKASHA
jgi:hypothetical protein